MKTIKLEISVKLLLGAIALGLFLNVANNFVKVAYASGHVEKVTICYSDGSGCGAGLNYGAAPIRVSVVK